MKGLLASFDRTLNIARAAIDLAKSEGDSATLVIELREHIQTLREDILSMREQVTTLLDEKRELTERLAEATNFLAERDMYTQVVLKTGSVVYVRNSPSSGEYQQPVYFCANCFQQGRTTILDLKQQEFGYDLYNCPACNSTAHIPHERHHTAETIVTPNRWRDV
ncbi:MAG TPA: hypothetical protein DD442_15650 [Halomonas sp.]|jgi:DNA-directed RNA polymerase subunit RPC12/RpoP|nr:hypothetical protein [Halomonas sp. UBA1491]HBN61432.1 hypothetical protein [Halomonas sp.]|tara:strand:- start:1951 stop:2445 length:495 start_codon:yes stop_codon:yes gene_type:complete